MRLLRTPEERFAGLPGFGYPPRYVQLGGIRLAYVQAGPPDGEPVLLLHGEPSWSFLYRSVLPVLAAAGLNAIAPDLIGFGRSDKPAEIGDHSYARHVEWIRAFAFDHLGLAGLTLVGHDWGGLIGLRLVAEHPDRFARVVAANTGLPTGDQPMPDVWLRFRDVVRTAPALSVSRLVQSGCQRRCPRRSGPPTTRRSPTCP
jgi:haloalkane dehalogenase